MGNKSLRKAKKAKNDEFYTQLTTIENEVMHYREHFKGKTVYLNCDDPRESNFFHYFSYNFKKLGLKKLIASCYKSNDFNLFSLHDVNEKAVWLEYTGETDGGRVPTAEAIGVHYFKGDGDFRSDESIKLLKEADIVVTNPPFSLFREFIAQMIEHDKKFLVLGNMNAISYKEFFPLIKDNKVWPGVDFRGTVEFKIPKSVEIESNSGRVDNDGNKFLKVQGVTWWTNLDYPRRHRDMILFRKYEGNEDKYPKYDNYDAINVDKVADIPLDYKGVVGVPITFIGQWNPEQFEIVGLGQGNLYKSINGDGLSQNFVDDYYTSGGKGAIKKNHPVLGYYKNGKATIPYMRILIRNKHLNSSDM